MSAGSPIPGHLLAYSTKPYKLLSDVRTAHGIYALEPTSSGDGVAIAPQTFGQPGALYRAPNLQIFSTSTSSPEVEPANIAFIGSDARVSWVEQSGKKMKILGMRLPNQLRLSVLSPSDRAVVSKDRKYLAVPNEFYANIEGNAAGSAFIYIVDIASGRTINRISCPLQNRISFVPGRNEIVGCANGNGVVSLWDIFSRSLIWTSGPELGRFNSVAVSPNGHQIAACNERGFAVWDAHTGRSLSLISDESGYAQNNFGFCNRICYSADSRWILLGDRGGARIWRAPKEAM